MCDFFLLGCCGKDGTSLSGKKFSSVLAPVFRKEDFMTPQTLISNEQAEVTTIGPQLGEQTD